MFVDSAGKCLSRRILTFDGTMSPVLFFFFFCSQLFFLSIYSQNTGRPEFVRITPTTSTLSPSANELGRSSTALPSTSPASPSPSASASSASSTKSPSAFKRRCVPFCRPGFVGFAPVSFDVSPYAPSVANPGFVGPVVPQPVYAPPEPIPIVVDVEWLDTALLNRRKMRVLDATPSPQRYQMDYRQFRDEYYGKWDRLFGERANIEFQRVHIPSAVHFNMDIATYPAWNDPSALYPPDLFQQYVQRLGINMGEHLIIYSRGSLGGMLEAARVWNMFRIYGYHKVSVLDGGFDAWRSANLSLTDTGAPIQPGNWTAAFDPALVVTFEDMTASGNDGFCVLNRLFWYNFLDARPKPDFYGLNVPLGQFGPQNSPPQSSSPPPIVPLPPNRRSNILGSKTLPAEDLVRPDGFLLPVPELRHKLQQSGYIAGRESVAAGNTAEEASMVVLALAMAQDPKVRLYNAGIPEIRLRAPKLINV